MQINSIACGGHRFNLHSQQALAAWHLIHQEFVYGVLICVTDLLWQKGPVNRDGKYHANIMN